MRYSLLFGGIALLACACAANCGITERASISEARTCKSVLAVDASANEGAAYTLHDVRFDAAVLEPVLAIGCPGCHVSRDAGAAIAEPVIGTLVASSGGMPG